MKQVCRAVIVLAAGPAFVACGGDYPERDETPRADVNTRVHAIRDPENAFSAVQRARSSRSYAPSVRAKPARSSQGSERRASQKCALSLT